MNGYTMTTQKIQSLTLGALLVSLGSASAQSESALEETIAYQPFSVSLDAGTLGLGASLGWRFHDHFGARIGVGYAEIGFDGAFEYESQGVNPTVTSQEYDVDLELQSQFVGLDIYPWRESSFRITAGVLLNQNEFSGTAIASPNAADTYVFNGNTYQQSAVGNLTFSAEQDEICPFITIGGQIHFDKKKRWALGGEIGVVYTGSPDVSLTSQNTLAAPFPQDLEAERRNLEEDAKDFKFYPIVKLSLSFSF